MWQVENNTPFPACGATISDGDGIRYWCIAISSVFKICGSRMVALPEETREVSLRPQYAGPADSELLAEGDFFPFRDHPDIIIQGCATAPDAKATTSCPIDVTVGHLHKRAVVIGRRTVRKTWRGLVVEGPAEFVSCDLSWRHALGGQDVLVEGIGRAHPDNPIGLGWTSRWTELPSNIEFDLAMIEDPDKRIVFGEPLPKPHGFGPIPAAWTQRLRHGGTYDDGWLRERAPLHPTDFSPAFYQSAPPDQIYPCTLRGGEPATVAGLHPDGPCSFEIPRIVLEVETRIGLQTVRDRAKLITLVIDGSKKTVAMIWNAAIRCDGFEDRIRGSTVSLREMSGVQT